MYMESKANAYIHETAEIQPKVEENIEFDKTHIEVSPFMKTILDKFKKDCPNIYRPYRYGME